MSKKIIVRLPGVTNRSYPVIFSASFRPAEEMIARGRRYDGVFIISDSRVMRLYGSDVARRLTRRGVAVRTFSVPPGEASKSRAMKERLENRLLRSGITRSSLIVALGGGMTGDLAGFTASTLLRGIPCLQLPTTLLSQVDSSVGGKVAVNHPLGKNLIGAFSHPVAVQVNTSVLRTLPERQFRSGMAEVIKYAAVLDADLFEFLRSRHRAIRRRSSSVLAPVIIRCCELKAAVVRRDERDTGHRRMLNFGHTVGHALERAALFTVPHGYAVSAGMAAEARLSREKGFLAGHDLDAILDLLTLYGLPVDLPASTRPAAILAAMGLDKKKAHGRIGFTLLRGIGRAVTGITIPDMLVKRILQS